MSATEDYPDQEELEELGQQYINDNPEDYEDPNLEALGAAAYIEQSPTSDEKAFIDIADYFLSQGEEDTLSETINYKAEMGGGRYEGVVEAVSDKVEEANGDPEIGIYASIITSLYQEKLEDLDEADETIDEMLDEISELETDSTPEFTSDVNVNWGNQILSELPPNNWNMGNQIVMEDSLREGSEQEDSQDVMDYWEELDETGPDSII